MTTKEFDTLIGRDAWTLVDFFATWCGPCRALHPIVDRFREEMRGRVELCKVDVDSSELAAVVRRYGIRSVPTLLFFRRGQVLWRASGWMGYDELANVFRQLEQQPAGHTAGR